MALLGNAVMAASYDIEPGWESAHDDWHSHEHMLERVGIPGFLRGRRYEAEGHGRRYFVFYEAQGLEVLTSDAYLQRLNNPTPWSTEVMVHMQNMQRTLCQARVAEGTGIGGRMTCVSVSPGTTGAKDLRTYIGTTLRELVRHHGVLGGCLLEGDDAASRIETEEKALRASPDDVAQWMLVVEGYRDVTAQLLEGPLGADALIEAGAQQVGEPAPYRLVAVLARGDF